MFTEANPLHRSETERRWPDPVSAAAQRARRQSDLLDEALLETFPASDPVSVVRVQ